MSGAQISVRLRPVKATPGEARGSRSGESGTPENFRPSLSPKITLQKPGKQTGLGRYEKVFRYETVKEVLKCLIPLEVSKIEAKARVCVHARYACLYVGVHTHEGGFPSTSSIFLYGYLLRCLSQGLSRIPLGPGRPHQGLCPSTQLGNSVLY